MARVPGKSFAQPGRYKPADTRAAVTEAQGPARGGTGLEATRDGAPTGLVSPRTPRAQRAAALRILVFFPTFNEAGNVERLIQTIGEYLPSAHILVVDDASPDGTGAILD